MHKRINIMLPEETIKNLDHAARPGERSNFIVSAINYYFQSQQKAGLRQKLKQGSLANAGRDLDLARQWFPLEEDIWQKEKKQKNKK